MKQIFFAIAASLLLFACKKGDTGPQGEPGTDGTNGMNGNANAVQYTFPSHNFASGFASLHLTTTKDTMDNSTWLVYMFYEGLGRWYFVPGYGTGGATFYRVSMDYGSSKVNLYVDKIGPGETYSSIKVVRIYNNLSVTGGRPLTETSTPVDYTNYEAVRKYYQLP